jgi:hypothetical protein
MLSREEHRQFNGIAQALTAEDPRFRTTVHPAGFGRPLSAVPVLCALLYIVSPILMLLLGWAAVAGAAGLFAVALIVVWLRRVRRP